MTAATTAQRLRSPLRWLTPDIGQRPPAKVERRNLQALAMLLVLTQLPHLLHLPLWVSAAGALIVGLRLLALRHPEHPGLRRLLSPLVITLIATAGALLIRMDYGYFIGRDPCVAFLFLLVAAKFAEFRQARDATLLLCLAAFLLLTQYFYSQTIIAALVTLPAVLALGHALAVIRDPGNPASSRQQFALIAKLLLQGAPLAALLFIVFPRLPGPLWSLPEDAMGVTGLSDSMAPGTIGALSQSDAVAFRVEFDEAPPPASMRYWRGPVLSEFDGSRWSAGKVQLRARPPANPTDAIAYTVMLQPHRQRWLFALDSAASLPRASDSTQSTAPRLGSLMYDGQLIANTTVSQVLRYRQRSVITDRWRTSHQPPASALQLAGRNPRTTALAQELRQSVSSDLAFANAVLQKFNRENFHYTLQPQLLGDSPVDEFLFDSQEGFCEHYASAFTVMMRAAGIPARIVTGYLGGEMNEDYMIVRQSDAHAWTEAWIDGAWQRFDPTAAVAPSRVEGGLSAALPDSEFVPGLARMDNSWLRQARLRMDALNHHWQRLVIDYDNDSQTKLWDKLGLPRPALWQITAAMLIAAGVWCVLVLGVPWQQRRALAPEEAAWQKLCRLLTHRGLPRVPGESAADYLHRAAAAVPAKAAQFDALNEAFTKLRFTRQSDEGMKPHWETVRSHLARLRSSRWRVANPAAS